MAQHNAQNPLDTFLRSFSVGPVNAWMDDRLRAGKPSRYVTSHLRQLSLPSLRVHKSSNGLSGVPGG